MSECAHTQHQFKDGEWKCRLCGIPISTTDGLIDTIISSGKAPLANIEPDGYFSGSLGRYVSNKREHKEWSRKLNDPDFNEDHVCRPIAPETEQYIEDCQEQGIVP